jgi:hypothetical protein
MSSEENQTIFRVYEGSFTTISNVVLHDDRLSFDAVGLLCRILSLPRDWDVGTAHLRKKYAIGRDKLYRMIKELREFGYMRLVKPRDDAGRLKKAVYYMAADPRSLDHLAVDIAEEKAPHPEKPDVAAPCPEKPGLENASCRESRTHTKETESTKETDSQKALTRNFDKSIRKDEGGGEEARWRHRLELYRQKGVWPPNGSWGPRMGLPGCQVPEYLVKLWDETQGAAFKPEKPATRKKPAQHSHATPSAFRRVGDALPRYNRPGTSHD